MCTGCFNSDENEYGECIANPYPSVYPACNVCHVSDPTTTAAATTDPCTTNLCSGKYKGTDCFDGTDQGTCEYVDPADPNGCLYCQITVTTTAADTTTADPCADSCAVDTQCHIPNTSTYGQCVAQDPDCPICEACPCPVQTVCYDEFQKEGMCQYDQSQPTSTLCPYVCVVPTTTTAAATTSDPCANACTVDDFCNNNQGTCRDGWNACNYCDECANACTPGTSCSHGSL
eukprot:627181_1